MTESQNQENIINISDKLEELNKGLTEDQEKFNQDVGSINIKSADELSELLIDNLSKVMEQMRIDAEATLVRQDATVEEVTYAEAVIYNLDQVMNPTELLGFFSEAKKDMSFIDDYKIMRNKANLCVNPLRRFKMGSKAVPIIVKFISKMKTCENKTKYIRLMRAFSEYILHLNNISKDMDPVDNPLAKKAIFISLLLHSVRISLVANKKLLFVDRL